MATIFQPPDMGIWYQQNFPDDELGAKVPHAPFQCLLDSLLAADKFPPEHWYVSDSVIRERLFGELSTRLGTDYGFIYDLWLEGRWHKRFEQDEPISTQVIL